MTIYKLTDFNGNSKPLHKPNLIINGDFQINQRGKTSYSSTGYTLDMWRAVNASVEIRNDGIMVSSQGQVGYFNQKLSFPDSRYTSVLNVEIISGSASHYADGAVIDNGNLTTGINVFRLDGALTQYGIRLEPNSSIKIIYTDLFEGDIAYAHIKEDKATALMRCKYEVLNLNDGDNYTICQYTNGSSAKFVVWNTFRGTPSIVDYGMQYFNSNLQWVDCESPPQVINHGNYLEVIITCQNVGFGSVLIRRLPLLTCEP